MKHLPFALHRMPHEPVGYREGVYLYGHEFLRRIGAVQLELDSRNERVWGIFMEDSYDFAVSLLALLLSKKKTIILPHLQRGFLESAGAFMQGLFTDRRQTRTALPQLCYADIPDPTGRSNDPVYDVPDGEVVLFTSGSTGKPKLISKRFSQLCVESRVLESLWGRRVDDSVILSTVTHQHIYGLLFRVIWPLMSQRCLAARMDKDPASFIEHATCLARVTLVSSPAYLRRMTECADLGKIAGRVAVVFSSGGPLPNHTAVRIHEQLGSAVREVLGSTETGGIAHRAQVKPDVDVPWTPLPSVEVQLDPKNNCLMVASPFEGSGKWYTTGDTAVFLDDGTFRLTGRADHIVKVEEKRLSLTELEQRLADLEWVLEAGATVQEGSRSSVVVAAVLSDQGQRYLDEHGKGRLERHLRNYLLEYFEPVLVPRKWRFVGKLPLNPQGKLVRSALLRLFQSSGNVPPREPGIREVAVSETTATLSLSVPPDLCYFNGHFPGQPVLPGVVQIDWAMALARKYLNVPARFRSIETVKFHAFITPNTTLRLTLRYDPTKETLHFNYAGSGCSFSSGRLVLETQ